jgi:homogentisate 1,2-dioxygenase
MRDVIIYKNKGDCVYNKNKLNRSSKEIVVENIFSLQKGQHALQAHVALPEGTFEEEHGRDGFFGRVSHLYHIHPPTNWTRIEGNLRPHALDLTGLNNSPTDDRALPIPFLYNNDVTLKVVKPSVATPYAFRNGDGDDVYFIHEGEGRLETDFGPLNYEAGDYIVIPRGTTYRFLPSVQQNFFLVIESKSEIEIPDRGMLGRNALFDTGVITTPTPQTLETYQSKLALAKASGQVEWEVLIKREDELTSVFYPFDPMDIIGWKGDLTVWKFNIRDFRPVMSHRYHLPPSAHTTFKAKNFVICTFAPRPFESDPEAVRVPFYHRNIDFDEVLFYHAGDFFSRDGIKPGMITFHPQGIHHGPHPKAHEGVKKKTETQEYAVMIDTKNPLQLTPQAKSVEWQEYWGSWGALHK